MPSHLRQIPVRYRCGAVGNGNRTGPRLASALVAALVFVTVPATAQRSRSVVPDADEATRRGEVYRTMRDQLSAQFAKADRDRDGKLSRDEATAHMPYLARNFDAYDLDADGFVTLDEMLKRARPGK